MDEKTKTSKESEERQEEIKSIRLNHLKSTLSHLERKSYYDGHLDLSPRNLTRWLDASDNNVLLAGARLRASIALRKKINLPTVASTYIPPHALSYHFGCGICGIDRAGSPVYFLLFGLTDMEGILQSCTMDQIVMYWASLFEVMIEQLRVQARDRGSEAHNILLIIDMQSCTYRNLRWPVLRAWATALQLYQELNAGLFKEILLINPPTTLPVIHRLLVSQMNRSVKELVKVIGSHNCLRHLLFRLEKHEIPAYLGGYKCDVDNNPYCRQDIVWPQKVPRWSYLTHPSLPANVINLAVEAGSVFKKELPVPAAGTRITFRLNDVTHPVTLMVRPPAPPPLSDVSKGCQTKPRPLYTARLEGVRNTQGGAISCKRPGTYSFVLDNSKDLIHMVRAKVKIEILPPEKFLERYAEKTTLGDSIDFSQPVTPAERRRREDLVLACQTCTAVDLNSFY